MSYTILTTIRSNGDDRMFAQVMGGGEDLLALWKEHTEAVQLELIRRGCDGSIVLKPTEKHPLEEVFANVKEPFKSFVANNQDVSAEYAFKLTVGSPPNLDNVRAAVGWCAVTMGRKGKYSKLNECLAAAVEQATKGKGQRHGGDRTPFLEQPWVRLYKTHGLGFLLGQADKKYNEALGKGNQEDQVREILGAIVYLGMALLVLEGRVK